MVVVVIRSGNVIVIVTYGRLCDESREKLSRVWMMYGVLRPFSVTFTLSFTLHDHMMTHLHPPTSSSPLDLVREGFSLFVLGSDCQRGPSPLSRFLLSSECGSAPTCSLN
jgi:hypothetical protein